MTVPFEVIVQFAGVPPVLAKTSPLVKGDSAEASSTYNGAIPAGWPGRPRGVWEPKSGSFSGGWPPEGWSGVQYGPGATAFTLMPLLLSCLARHFVNDPIAALVAA